MTTCPDYDGIYDGQGPCWTCQGVADRCPLNGPPSGPRRKPESGDVRFLIVCVVILAVALTLAWSTLYYELWGHL